MQKTAQSQPLVIDAHGHTLDLAFETQAALHADLGGRTDLPLMRAGGVTAQLTACWVPDAEIGGPQGSRRPLQKILQMIDYLQCQLEEEAGSHAVLATCAGDIDAARSVGKIAMILGLEGGDSLKGDISILHTLHRLGLRHLGLVHEGRNALGTATQVWDGPQMRLYDSKIDPPGGLSAAGKQFVREMDLLGILVDVTHMEESTFWDALEVATGPVVATHGNARSLHDTLRYLTDDQIRAIAETGGLICPSPTPLGPEAEAPSLDMLLNHIDYMVELVGVDHVGFGTDFLGPSQNPPRGLADIGESGNIGAGLRQRGHGTETVEKILGGNFMRVFRSVMG